MQTPPHVVVISSDTDTWVYGLGLTEIGWLNGMYVRQEAIPTATYIPLFSQLSYLLTLLSATLLVQCLQ